MTMRAASPPRERECTFVSRADLAVPGRHIRAEDNHTGNNSTRIHSVRAKLSARSLWTGSPRAKKLVLCDADASSPLSLLLLDLGVDHGLGTDELLHVSLGVLLRYY